MAWDKDIPQPTDRLKNSQSDILGNFQAIEAGTVPFDHLEIVDTGSAPSPTSGKAAIYTSTTRDQGWFKDSEGYARPFAAMVGFGLFDGTGGGAVSEIGTPFNLSATRISTGIYKVTFDTALPDADYTPIIGNIRYGNSNIAFLEQNTYPLAATDFHVAVRARGTGNLTDGPFSAVVFGAVA